MIEVRSALDITAQLVRLKERVGGRVGAKHYINRNNVPKAPKAFCESFQLEDDAG